MKKMKTKIVGILVCMLLIATFALPIAGNANTERSPWVIETVDSTGDVGREISIVLDSNDYPHISYYDNSNYDLKYTNWTGSDWDIQTVDSTGNVGDYTSIVLDSNDYPHISYFDYSNYDLKYTNWTGSDWDIQIVDSTGYVGMYPSIDLDSNDYPHISYQDCGHNGDLKYTNWTGSDWDIQTVDSTGYVGMSTSIDLDSNDYPHISYYDYNSTSGWTGDLKYTKWTGSDWDIQTVDSSGDVGFPNSIGLDSNDYPHISYYDRSNGGLKYAKWTGSDWDIQIVDSTGYGGLHSSIGLDSNDYPHISYYDCINDDLKYAKWTGSDWDIQIVDSSGDVGWYNYIALDSNDYPHISYYDYSNGDLKYAYMGAELEIGDITGGLGASSTIKNIGPVEAENVVWEIKFDGGIIFSPPGGVVTGGPVNIPTTSDVSITGVPIGFGGFITPLNIIVSADADNADPVSKTIPAKLLLFFVII